ncbi:MAG TPA: flippase-like domain-containing protein [Gemmatimonadaceae bacterium]|nr:flippase-like domain-containing protein [Gemmatimonadaceae bacterium]
MTPARWILAILSFAAAIGASIYVIYSSWPEHRNPAILPLWAHAACAAVACLEVLARGVKLKLAALALKIPLDLNAAVRTCVGGDFGAAITPARSGAEPARFLILAEAGVKPADNLLLLWVELSLEMLSLALAVIVFAIVFSDAGLALQGVLAVVGIYALFVIGLAVIGVALARRSEHGPPRWLARLGVVNSRWETAQRLLRRVRESTEAVRHAHWGLGIAAYLVSLVHVALRLAVLPIIVYALGATEVPLAPLVLWPLALFYGAVVAPVPGGGGVIELGFRHFLGAAIPAFLIGASLVWWRFYSFYILVIMGALAAGRTVMRALRDTGELAETAAENELQSA